MKILPPPVNDCMAALLKAHPKITDIWLLEGNAARECFLEAACNLIVICAPGAQAHLIEQEARALVHKQFEAAGIEVFLFPFTAIERMPRPLLVKMALTSGEKIYCG